MYYLLYVCIFVCRCVYLEVEAKVPSSITHHLRFWAQVLSLNLELSDSAGLAGQQSGDLMVSASPALGL